MDRLSVTELRAHPDMNAAFDELAWRLSCFVRGLIYKARETLYPWLVTEESMAKRGHWRDSLFWRELRAVKGWPDVCHQSHSVELKMCAAESSAPSVPRAIAEQEVVMVHWQIEQCLAMSFDKPTTIALVTEAVFLRKRLSKSVSYVLVQLGENRRAQVLPRRDCWQSVLLCSLGSTGETKPGVVCVLPAAKDSSQQLSCALQVFTSRLPPAFHICRTPNMKKILKG